MIVRHDEGCCNGVPRVPRVFRCCGTGCCRYLCGILEGVPLFRAVSAAERARVLGGGSWLGSGLAGTKASTNCSVRASTSPTWSTARSAKRWIASSTRTAIRPARASYEERRRKEDEHARIAAERHAALKDPNNATGAKARSRTMTASPNVKEVSPTSATAT
jgi:hypothetical protein